MLCTAAKTYALKYVETTNLQLLVEPEEVRAMQACTAICVVLFLASTFRVQYGIVFCEWHLGSTCKAGRNLLATVD